VENTKDRLRRSPVESNPAQELTVTVTVLKQVPDAFFIAAEMDARLAGFAASGVDRKETMNPATNQPY